MIKHSHIVMCLYASVDCTLILMGCLVPCLLWYSPLHWPAFWESVPNFAEYGLLFLLMAVFTIRSFHGKDLLTTQRAKTMPRELSQVLGSLVSTGILVGAVLYVGRFSFVPRSLCLTIFAVLFVLLGGWRVVKRLLIRRVISRGYRNINVLLIGATCNARKVVQEIKRNGHLGLQVIGILDDHETRFTPEVPVLGTLASFESVVKTHFVEEVIVTLPEGYGAAELLRRAKSMKLGTRMVPQDIQAALPVIQVSYVGTVPILTYKERHPTPNDDSAKRAFDIVGSAVLLLLTAPLLLAVAMAVKLSSRGPVLFSQVRIGHKGRPFSIYKFRSMVLGAPTLKNGLLDRNDVDGGVTFKMRDDPRVTRVGRFLRRYSLDELPQLLNVLTGDMSLVGPRPPLASEMREYKDSDLARLTTRPGMTGLSQIRGRADLRFDRCVKWDIWYVNHWSFWFDLRILLRTVPAVLNGRGAY